MINYTIPKDIEKDAKVYMQNVLEQLDSTGMLENVDSAALTMLARNYSMFIKASKQLEDEGLTVTSDRGNIAPHPAIKIAKDAQTQAMKVMLEFGRTRKRRLTDGGNAVSPRMIQKNDYFLTEYNFINIINIKYGKLEIY